MIFLRSLRFKFIANVINKKTLSSTLSNLENAEIKDSTKVIGLTTSHQKNILKQRPDYNEDMQLLKVALIGAPNAGKSTLANKLINWKFSSVSHKVHTTRHKTLGVLTENNKQVVFLDTPGVIMPSKVKKHNLEMSLLVDPHQALHDADLIVVVVDVSNLWHRTHLEEEILKMLMYHASKPSLLVLNKVDLLKTKQEVLNVVRVLTEGRLLGRSYYQSGHKKHKADNKISNSEFLLKLFEKMKSETKDSGNSQEMDVDMVEEDAINDEISSSSSSSYLTPTDNSSLSPSQSPSLSVLVNQNQHKDHCKINLREKDQWLMYYSRLAEIGRSIKNCHGWPYFKEVFMISAVNGDGIYELKNYLLDLTTPSKWLFHEQVVTNQNPLQLAHDIVWEKLLDNLPEEIPYQIKIKLLLWHVDNEDLLRAQFELCCTKKRHIHKILGKNGEMIQKISSQVKQELMNAFKREMSLQLIVRGTPKTKPTLRKETE